MDDVGLAATLVQDAARLALAMRLRGVASEQKTSAADLVSAADRTAEALIKDRLRDERPEDGVLGEEGASVASRNGRRWVIDPVDGTFNFLSGLPTWCSAVALEHDGVLLAGAVDIPATRETWAAGRGLGTTVNGGAVEPLADKPLRDCSVASYLDRSDVSDAATMAVLSRLMDGAATLRISGSGTADLADVAAGRIGLWIQPDCADWDWLPGRALVEGVGGRTVIVEHLGRRWYLAGSGAAVDEAAERLVTAG